jgi:uncharacterized protein YecE (DUF72 family)
VKSRTVEVTVNKVSQLFLGCPQWWLPQWKSVLNIPKPSFALQYYSHQFNTVEGNTTFYAVPSQKTQQRWLETVDKDFRFCLKVPKSCTHSRYLDTKDLKSFADMVEHMRAKLGQVHLQLPPNLGWPHWSRVQKIVEGLPSVDVAVEVRHRDFFNKGDIEQRFTEWLRNCGANRVMFDSRGLFKERPDRPEISDAQSKKPRLPLHVMATSNQPMVRFIGFSDYESNLVYLNQWADKLVEWLDHGLRPYFFMHTSDNVLAPLFLMRFKQMLRQRGVTIAGSEKASHISNSGLLETKGLSSVESKCSDEHQLGLF